MGCKSSATDLSSSSSCITAPSVLFLFRNIGRVEIQAYRISTHGIASGSRPDIPTNFVHSKILPAEIDSRLGPDAQEEMVPNQAKQRTVGEEDF